MDRLVVTGGQRLEGCVTAAGAKNAVLPVLAATLLGAGECVISNLPQVRDVATMLTLLGLLGVSVKRETGRVIVDATTVRSVEAPYDLVKVMRASILVLGPLLARFGEALVSLPGGCAIGQRPVDLHVDGLRKLGATVSLQHGRIRAHAARLEGQRIVFRVPTVTGTENVLMAACLANGTTVLDNAACEPEITDLADFLMKRGARIHGAGSRRVVIEGVPSLRGAEHEAIPDRVETGTYLFAGAMTGGRVEVNRCRPGHMNAVLSTLRNCGVEVSEAACSITVKAPRRLRALDIHTLPYPGFPTDLQAPVMALLCLADGTSVITESVFEGRFLHIPELWRMGAAITVDGHRAIVKGSDRISGAPVMASDLRAGAGLVLAGLGASGDTRISRIYHVERGYEHIEEKLRSLGAVIRREHVPS